MRQLHGRSRLQRYSRLANWDYITEVGCSQSSEFTQIPLIGNGDIYSFTDYEEKILKNVEKQDENNGVNNLVPCASKFIGVSCLRHIRLFYEFLTNTCRLALYSAGSWSANQAMVTY